MEFSFNTIKSPVENILLKEKGSKFIGFAFPVDDEEDLKKSLQKIREEHPKATHHCYAFRLGMKGENYRANDDGEPSGSAGDVVSQKLIVSRQTGTTGRFAVVIGAVSFAFHSKPERVAVVRSFRLFFPYFV